MSTLKQVVAALEKQSEQLDNQADLLVDQERGLEKQTDILSKQQDILERTGDDVDTVKMNTTMIHSLIAEMLVNQEEAKFDALEDKRERRPQLAPPGSGGPSIPGAIGGALAANALTGAENLMNNILGGLVGGALGPKLVAGVSGLLGKGLKFGAIALAADAILNMVFENFEVPPDIANSIIGDTRRSIFGALIGSFFGKKLVGAVAGMIYDDVLPFVQNNDITKQVSDLIDPYTSEFGLDGDSVVAGATSTAAAMAGLYAVKKLPSLIRGAGRGLSSLATKVGPAVLSTVKATGSAAWNAAKLGARALPAIANAAKTGITTIATTANAPLLAAAATVGTLGYATAEYKDLLAEHPELAPMNNGAGPGLVQGRYLVENNLVDQAIDDQKRRGTYKDMPAPAKTRTYDPSATTLTPSAPVTIAPTDMKSIEDFINSTPKTPGPSIAPTSRSAPTADMLSHNNNKIPPVIIVPTPAPAAPASSSAGSSSTSIFTSPVGTVDRLDGMDRITRGR